MKLKGFSPLGFKIKQFLFMKRLNYIKCFLQQYQIRYVFERNKLTLYIVVTWPIFWRSITQKQNKISYEFYCNYWSIWNSFSSGAKYESFCKRNKFTFYIMVAWPIIWGSLTPKWTKTSHRFYCKYWSA